MRRHVPLLDDLARLELHLADGRTSVEAGALVEKAVEVLQPLRERVAIVRISADDGVTVDRQIGARWGLPRGKSERVSRSDHRQGNHHNDGTGEQSHCNQAYDKLV